MIDQFAPQCVLPGHPSAEQPNREVQQKPEQHADQTTA
jgi:hypothetical protein